MIYLGKIFKIFLLANLIAVQICATELNTEKNAVEGFSKELNKQSLKYKVKAGDTIVKIIKKNYKKTNYWTALNNILKNNKHIKNKHSLSAGEFLILNNTEATGEIVNEISPLADQVDSIKTTENTSPPNALKYKVKSGDTIIKIIKKFYTNMNYWSALSDLLKNNKHIKNKHSLSAGDVLDLPENNVVSTTIKTEFINLENILSLDEVKSEIVLEEKNTTPLRSIAQEEIEVISPKILPPPMETSFKSYSEMGISSIMMFQRIDSVDLISGGKAIFLSEPSFGFNGSWKQRWLENWSTGTSLSLATIKINKPQTGTIADGVQKIAQLEFYTSWNLNKYTSLKLHLGQKKRLFFRALTAGNAIVDSVDQGYAGVNLLFKLLNKDMLSLGLRAGYDNYFATDSVQYKIKESREFQVGPIISQDIGNGSLEFEINYAAMEQNLGIARQETKSVSARFGYIFKIGKQ